MSILSLLDALSQTDVAISIVCSFVIAAYCLLCLGE